MAGKGDIKAAIRELERIHKSLEVMRAKQESEISAIRKELIKAFKEVQSSLPPQRKDFFPLISEESDELYDEVHDLVIKVGKVSTSYLQRTFGIGYARAAKLIDMLEDRGVIGPANGEKPREILLSKTSLKVLRKIESQLKRQKKEGQKKEEK